ncbi:Crp/Fnr family transcriptional regulator [Candidatus Magnetaquicoccus inordinatus]|uniref:Crp/Fnr family transcriptional regulator n=1 Tax=Candidatus Magnetaquicoccus inordinatus TaxID=2496818 RepID=UPI00102BAFCA|nr:Crp/Fnr family transcriptional regulator [Candidatus Magnetaquicoccus inordinatus]
MLFRNSVAQGLGKLYAAGEIIFRQGDPADCCYAILEGQVEMSYENKDACWLSLEILEKNEVFGTTSLFGDMPRILTARAVVDSRLLTIDKSGFLQWIQEDPTLALRVLLSMANRSHRLIEQIVQLQQNLTGRDNHVTT